MKPKSKLYFGENISSEKFPQTSSNDFPEHKKYTKLKTNNIKDIYPLKNGKKKKNIKTQTKQHNNKIPNTMKSTKSLSFTYRYFDIGTKNKFRSLRDKSFGIKSIKENNTMRSNFIPLSNEANKYTSNANYIKNKRMQIFDISQLDHKSQTVFSESVKTDKNDKKFLYKTTIFRIGKYFLNQEKRKKHIIKRIGRNMPIEDIVDYLEQNEDNLNIFEKKSIRKSIIIEDNFQERRKQLFNNSLYKEIMNKKEEILDSLVNNEINKNQEIVKNNNNTPINNSTIYLNNTIEENLKLNNSPKKTSKNFNKAKSTNLLLKKEMNGIPIIFPKILTSSINYETKGQNSRYQHILGNFMKIKTFLENNKILGKKNEYDYIKEFLIINDIDKRYINSFNIMNFCKFLSLKELPIDVNKSLKDNILIALNYSVDKEKKDEDSSTIKKIRPELKESKNNFKKNKIFKRDETNLNNYFDKKRKLNIKDNYKSLMLDIFRQNWVYRKEEEKTDIKLNKELKLEINKIEDEILNKQKKIKEEEHNLNLIPFSDNYFNSKKFERKNNKKEKPIELRLTSLKEMRNEILNSFKIIKAPNVEEEVFNSNERLYYSWFRDKRKADINKFLKRTKLTELVLYNKTKEKILKDKYKKDFLL